MFGLFLISISSISLAYFIQKESPNRKIYAAITLFLFWIFMLRFACNDLTCVTNNFVSSYFTNCSYSCDTCNSIIECNNCDTNLHKTITLYQNSQKACSNCKGCSADWNIRIALDSSGFAIIGLSLLCLFLYYKNYSIQQFTKGLNSINLFGVLSFDISQIETEIERLSVDMKKTLGDEKLQEETARLFSSIHKNSSTHIDLLFLILDKIKKEEKRVENSFKTNEDALALKDSIRNQFKHLKNIASSFLKFIKKDTSNRYVNSSIFLGKEIIKLLICFLIRIEKRIERATKERYLKSTIGVGVINDVNDKILKKGELIPLKRTHTFTTTSDDQKTIESPILIGESLVASENQIFDTFILNDIPPKPAGQAVNEITIEITEFGVLKIQQKCHETGTELKASFNVNDFLIEKK